MKLIEDFNEMGSLEFLTATRVVTMIWNRCDIVRSITQLLGTADTLEGYRMWNEIDNKVLLILRTIERFPRNLRDDLEKLSKPIGREIRATRTYLNFSPYTQSTRIEFPVNHWTPYGTVDIKIMDRILVQDNRRDIAFRFHLACNDCFEEIIMELFPLLSHRQKRTYLRIERNRELLSYWAYRILGNLPTFFRLTWPHDVNEEPYTYTADQVAFKYTLANGSKSGIEYFMDHLEEFEFEYVIIRHVRRLLEPLGDRVHRHFYSMFLSEDSSDALYFLISRLNERQRNNILLPHYCNILKKFLMYPFYGLFNKYGNIWNYALTMGEITDLLSRIRFLKAFNTHFFEYELLNDFWLNLPDTTKEAYLNNLEDPFLLQAIANIERR